MGMAEAARAFVDASVELEKLRYEQTRLENRKNAQQARRDEAQKVLSGSVGANRHEKAWHVGNQIVLARYEHGVSIVEIEVEK